MHVLDFAQGKTFKELELFAECFKDVDTLHSRLTRVVMAAKASHPLNPQRPGLVKAVEQVMSGLRQAYIAARAQGELGRTTTTPAYDKTDVVFAITSQCLPCASIR